LCLKIIIKIKIRTIDDNNNDVNILEDDDDEEYNNKSKVFICL